MYIFPRIKIMLPRWLLLICFCTFFQWNIDSSSAGKMDVVYEWKYIDYDFGSEEKRQEAIRSGEYDYTKAVPMDTDRWKNLTFVTVTRAKGVPSSLNVVTDKQGPGGPLLKPYPDWSWTKFGDCDSITNVYRITIDKCDRLWVVDSGDIHTKQVCSEQLLVFDLNTSKLLKRIKIPKEIAMNATTGRGILITPVIDAKGESCENTTIYMSDVEGYALIYYNDDRQFFKRLTSWAFVRDPKYTTYTIEGESFTLQDGVVGMAISQQTRKLYFGPMSSHIFGDISIDELERSMGETLILHTYDNIVDTQESARAISKNGILFFGRVSDTSIGCWYEHNPITKQYHGFADKDPVTLQFTGGLKVREEDYEELWALTNRYQKMEAQTVNYNETNFRVLRGNIQKLVQGTVCEPHTGIPEVSPT